MNDKISSAAFKCRGLFWTLFAIGFLIYPGSFSAARYCAGFVLVVAGQLLRFWAAGYIPQYRTEVIGAPELITSGPYSYIRNPLYAGNFIMGFGWALMAGFGWLTAFCAAFFLLYCVVIIPAEEKFLEGKFGAKYSAYKEKTSALIPLSFPKTAEQDRKFDFKAAWACERYSIRTHVIVTVLLTARLLFSR